MNFFSGYFRTSRAIPGEIPGQAYGNFPSPLRKVLQSFPERTPVLPEKNWSTPRRGLETDTELLPQPSVYTLSQIRKGTILTIIYHDRGCYPSTMPNYGYPMMGIIHS